MLMEEGETLDGIYCRGPNKHTVPSSIRKTSRLYKLSNVDGKASSNKVKMPHLEDQDYFIIRAMLLFSLAERRSQKYLPLAGGTCTINVLVMKL